MRILTLLVIFALATYLVIHLPTQESLLIAVGAVVVGIDMTAVSSKK